MWKGHDPRVRAYFFWKWEYDRRNVTYLSEYASAIIPPQGTTATPSAEHFHAQYKHCHLDPSTGKTSLEILSDIIDAQSKNIEFYPCPPEDLNIDEAGCEGHHSKNDAPHFVISKNGTSLHYGIDSDAATHTTLNQDYFSDIENRFLAFEAAANTKGHKPPALQWIIPFAGLRSLFLPKGYRQKDNHLERAIGLSLYDLTLQGMTGADSMRYLADKFAATTITDMEERKWERCLEGTRSCIRAHEVLPLAGTVKNLP